MNYEEYNDYELVYLAKESNTDANEILFSKYSPIVYNYSKMYEKYVKNSGLEANDLIQEGMLGLNSAINSFDESKNVLFYTYAATCIKRTMLSAIVKANRQKAQRLKQDRIRIQRQAFNQECIRLSDPIGNENIKLLVSLLVKEHTRMIDKYSALINKRLAMLLNPFIIT